MTRDTLQFVDAISASPTVLLDLHNDSPFYMAQDGWSAPPPRLNRAATSSTSRDGSNVSQSAYADRELVITVGLNTVSQDQAAEAIQALARLLNSDGQWLKYQCAIEPVFFRTKRGEIDSLSEFNGQADGFREVTIRIPAEPFAYGLPVTGTATIANDPTAATNPMSYVFPAIQGDVVTPLVIRDHVNSLDTAMLSMSASASAPSPPLIQQTFSTLSVTGWASTAGVGDASAIGGTTNAITKSSGTNVYGVTVNFPAVPLGDWRMVMRARSSIDYSVRAQRQDLAAAGRGAPTYTSVPASSYRYVDLGVMRLPSNGQASNPPGLATAGTNSVAVNVTLNTAATSGTIYPDAFMLVPAGLDDAAVSTLMLGGGVSPAFAIYPTQIDGLSNTLWVGDGTSYYSPASFAGALPQVAPGQRNVMTLVQSTRGYGDVLATSVTLDWLYYPNYLYIRPATS